MWPKTSALGAFSGRYRGTCWRAAPRALPATRAQAKFANQFRRIAPKCAMPDDVGIVASPQRPVLIPVRLDIEQREGAEHAGHVGRGNLMQIGLVELTEAGDAEQPKAADHLVLEQF